MMRNSAGERSDGNDACIMQLQLWLRKGKTMNLISGRLVEVFVDSGVKKGKVQVGGAFTNVLLTFLPEARVGDLLLVDAGVAIGILSEPQSKEIHHVPGHSR